MQHGHIAAEGTLPRRIEAQRDIRGVRFAQLERTAVESPDQQVVREQLQARAQGDRFFRSCLGGGPDDRRVGSGIDLRLPRGFGERADRSLRTWRRIDRVQIEAEPALGVIAHDILRQVVDKPFVVHQSQTRGVIGKRGPGRLDEGARGADVHHFVLTAVHEERRGGPEVRGMKDRVHRGEQASGLGPEAVGAATPQPVRLPGVEPRAISTRADERDDRRQSRPLRGHGEAGDARRGTTEPAQLV